MVEIVAWQFYTRVEAFNNITTATRVGRAQFVWDTTSKGKNELILALEALHSEAPIENQIVRGTTFDNPMLSRTYLRNECRKYRGRRRQEELEGKVFAETAGALWSQETIDATRRLVAPESPALVLVSVDPAQSAAVTADEFGICVGARGRDGHSYVLEDRSGHYTPDEWGKIVVDRCALDAAGVLIERNRAGGDSASHVVVSEARTRGMKVEILPRGARVPARRVGVIFVKEIVAASDKATRAAGPAAEYTAARAHLVGEHPELELELTTYEPGTRKSPNRYDAHAYLVTELAGLEYEDKTGTAAEDARGAVIAAEALRKALLSSARGRRIGL
jgi:phage terminase large subunit-like protein